jgi:hypothetical protein
MVCATCGDDATEMVERELYTVRPGFLCIVRTRATVVLPYCDDHVTASWNGFMRVVAKSIRDDGITLGQVSEDFVEAVEDFRENPERYRRRARGRARKAAHDEDDEDEEEDDDEEVVRRRRRGSADGNRFLYGSLMAGLVIVLVSACGGGLFVYNFFLRPGAGPRQPGLKQPGDFPPHKPPFGPGGRPR